jgi:ribokinase
MSDLVVVGSINVDLVVSAPRLPATGETVLGGEFARHMGGKGANQAVAAARAGARVQMVGAVGGDEYGRESVAALSREGVDITGVRTVDAPTGVALIAVAPDGENLIVVAPGANGLLDLGEQRLSWPEGAGVLLASLEVPMAAVLAAAELAATHAATIVINPAPGQRLPDALLALHPILSPNEQELLACGEADTADEAILALRARGAGPILVTRGAAGVLIVDEAGRREIPAQAARAVDATGAGDTFVGVLAAWLAEGSALDAAASAGNAAAALKVASRGAREGMPDREAIETRLRD